MSVVGIGENLPKGWSLVPVGHFADLCLGKMLDKNKNRGTPRPYLRNLNVRWFAFDLDDVLEMPFEDEEAERYSAQAGDLIVCEGGYPGRAAIWSGEPIFLQKALHRVRCHEPERAKWLLYYLFNASQKGELSHHCSGAGIQHLTGEAFRRMQVPLPPCSEQRRITDLLDAVMVQQATARAAAREMVDSINHIRADVFARLLGAEEWPTKPLIEVCHGKGQYGLSLKAHREPRGAPMLRMGNVQGGKLDWSDLTYVDVDEVTLARYAIKPGDILFNRTNSAELVGKSAVVREERPAVFASYLVRLRANDEIMNPEFLVEIINGPLGRTYVARHMGTAIGQVNISAGKMHDFPVPCPPIQEQHRIVAATAEIGRLADRVAEALSAQLSAIDALPGALLSAAFRGDL